MADTAPSQRRVAPDPDLRVVDEPEARRYAAYLGDHLAGFVTYREAPDRIVLIHTEIDPASQGKGLGSRLAREVLDSIRDRGLLMTPRCPFIRAFMERHPEYADLVAHPRIATRPRRGD